MPTPYGPYKQNQALAKIAKAVEERSTGYSILQSLHPIGMKTYTMHYPEIERNIASLTALRDRLLGVQYGRDFAEEIGATPVSRDQRKREDERKEYSADTFNAAVQTKLRGE